MGYGGNILTSPGQAELGSERMAVPGIALDKAEINQVRHALRKGCAAGAGRRQKLCLAARNTLVQGGKDGEGPSLAGDVDKRLDVHKIYLA